MKKYYLVDSIPMFTIKENEDIGTCLFLKGSSKNFFKIITRSKDNITYKIINKNQTIFEKQISEEVCQKLIYHNLAVQPLVRCVSDIKVNGNNAKIHEFGLFCDVSMLEMEFKSSDEAKKFQMPNWCKKEVKNVDSLIYKIATENIKEELQK